MIAITEYTMKKYSSIAEIRRLSVVVLFNILYVVVGFQLVNGLSLHSRKYATSVNEISARIRGLLKYFCPSFETRTFAGDGAFLHSFSKRAMV